MDPINNPTPTPNPVPNPVPNPESGSIAGVGVNPVQPVNNAAPVSPAAPTAPAQPVDLSAPTQTIGPSNTINPPAQPVGPAVNPINPVPANPVFKPTGVGVAATDPIMMPEQPKAPDPIEEELKAPMKAAAPAPGSIGSAVSGPTEMPAAEPAPAAPNPFTQPQTPNVSFTDPATQPEMNTMQPAGAQPVKKKSSKTTLIALIIVALMVIIALGAVFAIQYFGLLNGNGNNGSGSNSSNSNNSSNSSTVNPSDNPVKEDYGADVTDDETDNSNANSNSTTKENYTVVCSAKTTAESGDVTTTNYTVSVVKNKFSLFTTSKIVDNTTTGETTKTEPTTIEYSEFLSTYYPTDYKDDFDAEKTLSIIPSVFATRLQEGINKGSTIKYTCSYE